MELDGSWKLQTYQPLGKKYQWCLRMNCAAETGSEKVDLDWDANYDGNSDVALEESTWKNL